MAGNTADSTRGDVLIESISHLDFKPSCEHSQHAKRHPGDEPAKYIVRCRCDACTDTAVYLLCKPGWDRLSRVAVLYCNACGWSSPDIHLKILETLP